jgi:hypothetical protein
VRLKKGKEKNERRREKAKLLFLESFVNIKKITLKLCELN